MYQRNYTWTDKVEARKFIDDLHDAVTGRYVNRFLGTIICSTKELDGLSWENSIIDGQQKLTATFLFLYAVRDIFLAQEDADSAEDLEAQYLIKSQQKYTLRLKPLVTDDGVYKMIVEKRIGELT